MTTPDTTRTKVFTQSYSAPMTIRGTTMFTSEYDLGVSAWRVKTIDMTGWTYGSPLLTLMTAACTQMTVGPSGMDNDVLMSSYNAGKVARWKGLATDTDYAELATGCAATGVAANATTVFYSHRLTQSGAVYSCDLDGSNKATFVSLADCEPNGLLAKNGLLYVVETNQLAANNIDYKISVYDDSTGALVNTIGMPTALGTRFQPTAIANYVPEPVSLTVLALGGAALLRRRRRA